MIHSNVVREFLETYRRLGDYDEEAFIFGMQLRVFLKNESTESSKSFIQHY